jgi:hypothetical protein
VGSGPRLTRQLSLPSPATWLGVRNQKKVHTEQKEISYMLPNRARGQSGHRVCGGVEWKQALIATDPITSFIKHLCVSMQSMISLIA